MEPLGDNAKDRVDYKILDTCVKSSINLSVDVNAFLVKIAVFFVKMVHNFNSRLCITYFYFDFSFSNIKGHSK